MNCCTRGLLGAVSITLGSALLLSATAASADVAAGTRELPKQLQGHQKVQDLGEGKYRIGLIEVDRPQGRLRIRGRVERVEPPLEFLAVGTGGFKAYESVLELGASPYEFNLACILIGLDAQDVVPSKHHFDPNPVVGAPVSLFVEWTGEDGAHRVPAASLLKNEEGATPSDDWIYTGSVFTPDGQYLAQMDGTVVGFVHDPASIIEHRTGVGLGAFGSVLAAAELLPPVGGEIFLVVERIEGKQGASPEEQAGAEAKTPTVDAGD